MDLFQSLADWQSFADWAWARHHNLLSWYIRPLFLMPYVWFAWRRSLPGMLATVVALATSMFWFPAPEVPDPRAVAFLEAERQYLLGPWSFDKLLFSASVPIFFGAVGLAFWRRSIVLGLAAVTTGGLVKLLWGFLYGGRSGWAVLAPALTGLVVVNVAVLILAKRWGAEASRGGPESRREGER